jgi:hypothetical protein
VDILRGEREGRRFLDEVGVEALAAGHLRDADAFAGDGEIFGAQEIAKAGEGGADLAGDGGAVGGAQAFALGFRHGVG